MTYVITSDIPPPKARRVSKWPYDKLKVGQSFLADTEAENLSSSRRCAEKRTGFKFRTAREAGGWRVWRVA